MDSEKITIEQVEEFYTFLQGKVPECLHMKRPPHLTGQMAFKIIYYLQEVLHIIPDKYERCKSCKDIYDIESEGNSTHCESCRNFPLKSLNYWRRWKQNNEI